MNKELSNLIELYECMEERDIAKLSGSLPMLCKTRNKSYNSVILSKETDIQEDIVQESLAWRGLLKNMAINPEIQNGAFEKVMTVFANMNKATFGLLEEDAQMQLIESEIGAVRDVLKTLKKHPHKAGVKIKSTKIALNSLNNDREDLLDKWKAERETFEDAETLPVDDEPTL